MKGLADFLRDNDFNTFTIRTNKNTYKCNLFCVYLSNVVRAKLEEDPNNKHFFYNFKDEFNEFQLMCDLFNLKSIKITRNEIDSLTEIVDDLQIECLSNDIDNFNRDIEKSTQKIDDLFQNSYILIFKCSIPLKLNFFTQNAIFRTYYLIFFTSLPFITYFPNFFSQIFKRLPF
ncbi:hypothetical protein M9Y10_011002 [Tritrichomonas musculus]|uniref:Uncharacterized protein n=1 Tax=Tritrichomonas musculus TaxID=1915356 RepID=A0ABR2IMD1_9EUKA